MMDCQELQLLMVPVGYGYMVDALGPKGYEGRGVTAISLGEPLSRL